MDKIIKNTTPSVQAANLKAHFTQQRLFQLVFKIKMLLPAEIYLHAKMCEKLR